MEHYTMITSEQTLESVFTGMNDRKDSRCPHWGLQSSVQLVCEGGDTTLMIVSMKSCKTSNTPYEMKEYIEFELVLDSAIALRNMLDNAIKAMEHNKEQQGG